MSMSAALRGGSAVHPRALRHAWVRGRPRPKTGHPVAAATAASAGRRACAAGRSEAPRLHIPARLPRSCTRPPAGPGKGAS
jgi:hypothetical protein